MYDSFDRKGKIFTDVVTKEPIEVLIQTPTNIISGKIHIRPDQRLKDELSNESAFIAVTNAVIKDLNEKILYKSHFIAVNYSQLIWILPINELDSIEEKEEAA